MGRTQPRKDVEYIAWIRNMSSRCTANREAWRLDSGDVATLDALVRDADAAYAANINPETSSHRTAVVKKTAFREARKFFSLYIPKLTANMLISEADLNGMGLPSRERRFRESLPHRPIRRR
jgi:hypothetical protein